MFDFFSEEVLTRGFFIILGTIGIEIVKALWRKRKKYIRDRKVGNFNNHVYFLTAQDYQQELYRYVAPNGKPFYTVIIKSYHGAILENFNAFANTLIAEDMMKMSRKTQIRKTKERYAYYANRIIKDTDNLEIPEPLFSAIRKDTMQVVHITQIGIMEILDSPKFSEITNKEMASMILRELRKFLMYSETHLIPAQSRLNGKYKGLTFVYKGTEYVNE